MASQNKSRIGQGYPLLPGANKMAEGYNFAVEVPDGAEASLVLYYKGAKVPTREISFTSEDRLGKVRSLMVAGIKAKEYEYNFRIDGRIVQDPCAYSIRGREHFGAAMDAEDEHRIRCGFLPENSYDWEGDCAPSIPYEEMILYKIHVRGYTKQYKLPAKEKGTFRGLIGMIPYWQSLGINAVELMPAYEFMEIPPIEQKTGLISEKRSEGRVNYWGYLPGYYFAPKRSYCATKEPEREFKDMVKALHQAGIECIMELYFPKETRPLVALRTVLFWKLYYHVDGFHLLGDGAPVELLRREVLLSDTKIMAAGFPAEDTGNRNLAEYHMGFLQDMRRFLKSDEGMLKAAEYHIRRNPKTHAVVNYMACQDGFTLYDAVTYNYKHNETNGENNHDGSDYNYSWNCGIEGPSRKLAIRQIRERQMKNAFLLLLLSQGVPMIYGGDEIANSQDGNNNAYCQDNPVGWIDWKGYRKNQKLLRFVQEAIGFRKAHPILHTAGELKGIDYLTRGLPDISFHGERAWYLSYENTCRLLGVMYCGAYAQKEDGTPDDTIFVAYNFHWESRDIALPNLLEGMKWKKIADTSRTGDGPYFSEGEEEYEKKIQISPRTIVVLLGR